MRPKELTRMEWRRYNALCKKRVSAKLTKREQGRLDDLQKKHNRYERSLPVRVEGGYEYHTVIVSSPLYLNRKTGKWERA